MVQIGAYLRLFTVTQILFLYILPQRLSSTIKYKEAEIQRNRMFNLVSNLSPQATSIGVTKIKRVEEGTHTM